MIAKQIVQERTVTNLRASNLKRKGVTYAPLMERLAVLGIDEKEVSVRTRLSRWKFKVAFQLKWLK